MQGDTEPVVDFILQLECTFCSAYGGDSLSDETRDALLHGQLQEWLRYEIMEAPAVLGASKYSELCLAARNEEQRQHELTKRRRLTKPSRRVTLQEAPAPTTSRASANTPLLLDATRARSMAVTSGQCFKCN